MELRLPLILLFFVWNLGAGVREVIQTNILSTKVPILIVLGPKEYLDRSHRALEDLLDTDELIELKLTDMQIQEDGARDQPFGAWVRGQFGLEKAHNLPQTWLLIGLDGRKLAAGTGIPSTEVLCQSLASAGDVSQVANLKAFLKAHPEHEEARIDLIRALRSCVELRLQRRIRNREAELADQEDTRVWGGLAREVDALLQNENWSGFYVTLDELLPAGTPEAFSPLMKNMYRRHLPRLLGGLERYPECAPLLRNLLRINEALGTQNLLPILVEHPFFHPPINTVSLVPYAPLANRIQAEALRTGNWNGAAETLSRIWNQMARPRLQYYDRAWIASRRSNGNEADLQRLSRIEREEAWSKVLAPLISMDVKAGLESAIPALLESLDESWDVLKLGPRLQTLAASLGRASLAPIWIASLQDLAVRIPREGMLGTELRVFYQGQSTFKERATWVECLPFREVGISIDIWPAPLAWRQYLDWNDLAPKWALVDSGGRVILHGEEFPGGEHLLELFRSLRIPTALERVDGFLKEHPDHLVPLAFKAELQASIAQAFRLERRQARGLTRNNIDLREMERRSRSEACALLRRLVQDPLSTCPSLLERYALSFPKRGVPDQGVSEAEETDLARQMLPRLEEALTRWPRHPVLWRAWSVFASYRDDSPVAFLATLHPSPTAQADPWPSGEIMALVGENLRSQGRWQDIVDLLQPWIQSNLDSIRSRPHTPKSIARSSLWRVTSESVKNLLIEAYLNLGRAKESEEFQGLWQEDQGVR